MLRDFWNNVDTKFSHINYSGHLGSEYKLKASWQKQWLWRYNGTLKDAVVVEYGIGGGLLGEHLFDDYKIQRYIGIDISERQLAAAAVRLRGRNFRLERVDRLDASIVLNESVTFFVCQAVIQHFESLDYFYGFAREVERIRAPRMMIQTRDGGPTSRSDPRALRSAATMTQVQFATHLSTNDVLARLPSYRKEWDYFQPGNHYHFYSMTSSVRNQ